jgi:hypothetical protein
MLIRLPHVQQSIEPPASPIKRQRMPHGSSANPKFQELHVPFGDCRSPRLGNLTACTEFKKTFEAYAATPEKMIIKPCTIVGPPVENCNGPSSPNIQSHSDGACILYQADHCTNQYGDKKSVWLDGDQGRRQAQAGVSCAAHPIPCRHPVSQRLDHDDATLAWSGWQINAFPMKYEHAFTVRFHQPDSKIDTDSEWSIDEQELLLAMGRARPARSASTPCPRASSCGSPIKHKKFRVWRLSWEGRDGLQMDTRLSPYIKVPQCNMVTTCAAFVKLEHGKVGGAWAQGAVQGKWTLCGTETMWQSTSAHTHVHPTAQSDIGSMLVALPAYVYGKVNLWEPRNWWFFPARQNNNPCY